MLYKIRRIFMPPCEQAQTCSPSLEQLRDELREIKQLIRREGREMKEGFTHLTEAVVAVVDEIRVAIDYIKDKADDTDDAELEAIADKLDDAKTNLSNVLDTVLASGGDATPAPADPTVDPVDPVEE